MSTDELATGIDDDDDDFIPPPSVKRRRSRGGALTGVLMIALLCAGAFWGGAEVQKHQKTTSGTSTFAGLAGARTGRTGTGGAQTGANGTGGFGGGGSTIGQVTLVDGSNIYVTDTSGNVVKVTTSASSRFTKTDTGSLSDIKPGQTVVVQGAANADGTVAATSVTEGVTGAGTRGAGGTSASSASTTTPAG